MQGRRQPIAFQREFSNELDGVSKSAFIDVAVMLLHVIHENDASVDLQNPIELAGLLFAYARPILKARGDRDPLAFPPFLDASALLGVDAIKMRVCAASFDAPAWDDQGGRG